MEENDLDDKVDKQQLAASTPNVVKEKSFQSTVNDNLQKLTKNNNISGKHNLSQAKKHSFLMN